ncbi:MAG: hypothetical protein PHP62_03995 [Candidatus Moranbacteria bacterium]|nr:hypothetical protein [Candidatus Moranbacteria bacterium]
MMKGDHYKNDDEDKNSRVATPSSLDVAIGVRIQRLLYSNRFIEENKEGGEKKEK